MARGINKVILIGNMGRDPEIRYTPTGTAVATVSIATSEAWKDKQSGQLQERTEWHRVIFFSRLAEIVGEYLKKGSKIYIEGRLQTSTWNKNGEQKYRTEIIAQDILLLGTGNGNGNGSHADAGDGSRVTDHQSTEHEEQYAPAFRDEDIPF